MTAKEQLAIAMVTMVIADATKFRKEQAEAKTTEKKKDPRAEALSKFFSDNPKAFDCQRSHVIKLVSAITGLKFDATAGDKPPRLSVVALVASESAHGLPLEKPVLVMSEAGHVYSPEQPRKASYVVTKETRPATDEEFASVMTAMEKAPVAFYNYVTGSLGMDNAFPNGNGN